MKSFKRYVIGNWKMNGTLAHSREWCIAIKQALAALDPSILTHTQVAICVPFPYLYVCQKILIDSPILWGAQNVSEHATGAYTGEISATMLHDFACHYVIVGHSERRTLYGEGDAQVAHKCQAALDAGLHPIVCVGETLDEREAGKTESVVLRQLQSVVDLIGTQPFSKSVCIAYEPIWAIGTGRTASAEQAQTVHQAIQDFLAQDNEEVAQNCTLLYGGSVNGNNAADLFAMPSIHGGLIGGASLQVDSLMAIVTAGQKT